MVNILHTIDSKNSGGAEWIFIELFRRLDKEKFNSFAAVEKEGWSETQLRKLNFNPIILKSQGAFNIKYLLDIIKIIKKYNIDIIQSHLFGSNVYCSIAGIICNVPVISTFHGHIDIDKNDKLLRYKFSIINKGSKRIVFVSDHLKNYYLQNTNVRKNKTLTIHNGIDTSHYIRKKNNDIRNELGLSDKHILIGSIGNIGEAKGYDILMKAAASVNIIRPECRFIIVGDQSNSLYYDLLKLRLELKMDKVVYFLGFRHDVNIILNNCELFVLPSISEGLSIATLEAMSCGIPVVATKCGGPEEIVKNGVNGLLVNASDVQSLTDGILNMLENEQLRRTCIENAQERVCMLFSLEAMVNKYEKCYRDAAINKKQGNSDKKMYK